jgi:O-antigen ligase
MAWYLATTPTHSPWGRVWQVLNIVHVPAAVVGIMFSGSRVALVAVAPSLLYILLTVIWLPRRARATALAGIAGLFVALVPTVPPETMQRIISTADDPSQGDLNGRTDLWAQAYLTFQQHPFTGVGTGAFREGTTWKVAHNVWLRFAAELGLVGLGLFLLMMLLLFVGAGRSTRALGTFCYTVLTVWIIGATFYNAEDKKQTWLVLTLVLLAGTFRTEPSTGSEQEPAPGRPTAPGSEPLLLSDPPPLS